MGGSGSLVEVDETYTGFIKGANNKTPRRGGQYRNVVVTLLERGGSARSFHVDGTPVADTAPILRKNISRESRLMTDDARPLHRTWPRLRKP